jgi:heme o synthase
MSLLSQGAELSPQIAAEQAGLGPSLAGVDDFIALMKPRVMSLVVFTAVVGLMLAPQPMHALSALGAVLCIAAGAGAAGMLNMWYDADIDAVMARTADRPIPAGRVSRAQAGRVGLALALVSVALLDVVANGLAAGLLGFTIFFYVAVYTMWLKRSTPQNIVIGGAAGACPPLIGWAAATGSIQFEPLVLFLVIFLWTPPHFWALSLLRVGDYARAGIPMLPVVAGPEEARRQILIYSLCLAPTGAAPWLLGFTGIPYGITAIGFGTMLVRLAWRLKHQRDERTAKRLFGFSIVYLFVVFAALLLDAQLGRLLHKW